MAGAQLRSQQHGKQVLDVDGGSPCLKGKDLCFLVEVEQAAGGFTVLQPQATELVAEPLPQYRLTGFHRGAPMPPITS